MTAGSLGVHCDADLDAGVYRYLFFLLTVFTIWPTYSKYRIKCFNMLNKLRTSKNLFCLSIYYWFPSFDPPGHPMHIFKFGLDFP